MLELRDQEQFAAGSGQLLMALAEQLKLPFMHIARRAELCRLSTDIDPQQQLAGIELSADTALQLIDNYLMSMQLSSGQLALALEPVSVASVLNDTIHNLTAYANQYQVELELNVTGRFEPVMAHRRALTAALTSLGHVLIEAKSSTGEGKKILTLAAHRTNHGGITAGIYANMDGLSTDVYRRARQLYGRARQPLAGVSASAGAGIFIADTIFNALATTLRVAHHHKLSGLAATLTPSRQLILI